MKTSLITLTLVSALAVSLSACGERKVTADTGTAKATVETTAPANVVSSDALQTQAQDAATAASTPVSSAPAASSAAGNQ